MDECSSQDVVLEVTRRLARKVFAGDQDAETKVHDAVSVAWELSQTAPPDAKPGQVAAFAIKRIRIGRQFRQSVRSIDNPRPASREKPSREALDVAEFARTGDDPAQIVAIRLDLRVWWGGLSDRARRAAAALKWDALQ
jgi:hypothetical protein